MKLFYLPSSNQTFYEGQLQQNTGFAPTADPAVLASNGIYTVVPSENPCDPYLYSATANYTVVGNYANQSWTCNPYSLPTAKAGGEYKIKTEANNAVSVEACNCGFTTDLLTGVASQAEVDRATRYQEELESIAAIASALDANLTAIEAATSVDEINNIVNKPTGILFTGRGSGLGPEDLNVSYYTEFNSVSMTEADTELYVPSTAITIPYGSGGPNAFDSMGNAFNPGGPYTMQIRETATGMVIAEIEVPLNAAGEDVAF